jgi:general secretion pathway protein I
MVAVVLLAVGLSSLFTSEAGAIRIAQRARATTVATLLARCKMAEVEERILKEGLPGTSISGRDECCEDAEQEGFDCEYTVDRVVLPDQVFDDEGSGEGAEGLVEGVKSGAEGLGAGRDPAASFGIPLGDPMSMLAGGGEGGEGDPLASMVMEYTFPIMKPLIEEQVRRATVTVHWKEGSSAQSFQVVQFLVNEAPYQPPEEPDEPDPAGGGTGGGNTGAGNTGDATGGAP